MKQLPDKPSELIRLALKDLEAVERDPRYDVNMDNWHNPNVWNTCEVCLAGSVMAKSLNAPVGRFLEPMHSEDDDTYYKLEALNYFREGHVGRGVIEMDLLQRPTSKDMNLVVPVTPYAKSPTKFKADMRKMADVFESLGA